MTDLLTARAQVGLSYLIIGGYFAIKICEGLGYLKDVSDMNEIVMLVSAYWFMRQRPNPPPGEPNA